MAGPIKEPMICYKIFTSGDRRNPSIQHLVDFMNQNHITKEDVVTIISNEQVFENPITLIWEKK